MKLQIASEYANKIVEAINYLCSKIELAGSIRRKCPEVHDIDIVLIPYDNPLFNAWDTITLRLIQELNMEVVRKGQQLMTLEFKDGEFPVDIYRATPETWGIILLIRTGSKYHNVKLVMKAKSMGYKLSASQGLINSSGYVIASKTEEDIYQALGLTWEPPEARE